MGNCDMLEAEALRVRVLVGIVATCIFEAMLKAKYINKRLQVKLIEFLKAFFKKLV